MSSGAQKSNEYRDSKCDFDEHESPQLAKQFRATPNRTRAYCGHPLTLSTKPSPTLPSPVMRSNAPTETAVTRSSITDEPLKRGRKPRLRQVHHTGCSEAGDQLSSVRLCCFSL